MARVDTLPTVTVVAVMPVWSLKALAGMVRPDDVPEPPDPPPAAVVVVDEEVVELHAATIYRNEWNFWVYPTQVEEVVPAKVLITTSWPDFRPDRIWV